MRKGWLHASLLVPLCACLAESSHPNEAEWSRNADRDGDGAANDADCDDVRPNIHPGAVEVCNGLDDDCDGTTDLGAADAVVAFVDADADGFGTGDAEYLCVAPPFTSSTDGDCDDANAAIHPGATEGCAAGDENCDGAENEGAADAEVWFEDADRDGFGNVAESQLSCEQPNEFVSDATDCDDTSASIHPGAAETCDGTDEDCDGDVDEIEDIAPVFLDQDGDGFGDPEVALSVCPAPADWVITGDDCDDLDAQAYPGAPEWCDDNRTDEDCDGNAEDADADSQGKMSYYLDNDGDSYGVFPEIGTACTLPAGSASGFDDCDDTDSAVNPAAAEVCDASETDENCDGLWDDETATDADWSFPDADGDGFGDAAGAELGCPEDGVATGTDCDDAEAANFPNATEVPDDGVDQDCDGIDVESGVLSGTIVVETASALTIEGGAAGDELGQAVSFYGDSDGDGLDEIAVGAPFAEGAPSLTSGGVVFAFTVPITGVQPASTADATMIGLGGYQTGSALSDLGEPYGDGRAFLQIGSVTEMYGIGEPFSTYLTSWTLRDLGSFTCTSTDHGDRFGASLAALGDADGDRYPDWAAGSPASDEAGAAAGSVSYDCGYVNSTPFVYYGENMGDRAGAALAGIGDVDGDGLDDLAVGAPGNDDAHENGGKVYILTALAAGSTDLADADACWTGSARGQLLGTALAGGQDLSGDGTEDLVVGSDGRGAWVVFDVGLGATSAISRADVHFAPEESGDAAGSTVAVSPDVTGDSYPDLLIAAPFSDRRVADGGTVYVFTTPLSAGILDEPNAFLETDVPGSLLGSALDASGDRNGDRVDDLLVGAPGTDGVGTDAGSAFLLFGGG